MPSQYIKSVGALVDEAAKFEVKSQVLFRGQDCNEPLVPKIARADPAVDTTSLEQTMLDELRRRCARSPKLLGEDEWDALVVAQHYGMSTRLLDWTTNPLVALWFACADLQPDREAYVFMLFVQDSMMLDRRKDSDPLKIADNRVFKPSVNNDRLLAQSGWFTAHAYSKTSQCFVNLHEDTSLPIQVLMKGVKGADKAPFLRTLDRLGINQECLFPGLEGTCRYVDWKFRQRQNSGPEWKSERK